MEACIIIINEGHDKYMGYAFSNKANKKSYKGGNIPIFKTSNNQLIGVTGSEALLTTLKINPILLSNNNTIETNINLIRSGLLYKEWRGKPEVIILTSNNYVYRYKKGVINIFNEIEEPYMAFGKGSDIALGALYGVQSSRFSTSERVEISLKTVIRFYPELNNTGYFNL